MNRDNPTLRWLAWPLAIVLLGPLLYGLMFHEMHGIFSILVSGRTARLWPWVLLLLGYSLPVIVLLRWRRLVLSLSLISVLAYGQMIAANTLPELPKIVQVRFGNHTHESDVDVYCNDVFLGKTPFLMTEADFKAKVAPWTRPPEQPVVTYSAKEDGTPQEPDEFRWWYWTWTPGDPFEWPNDFSSHERYHDQKKLLAFMKTAPYWFRFEKDGCETLRRMEAYSGGGGGMQVITLHDSLDIAVQPKQRMKELVLAGLRALDYKPSSEWTAFVLKYRDELLSELFQVAETDRQLAEVLDRMADAHFKLPVDANRDASRAALERTFDSVSQREEEDFDRFARRTAIGIVKKYPELLVERTWQEVGTSPGRWLANYDSQVRRRRELLVDLWAEVHPPELFDLLVYLHGLDQQTWLAREDSRLMIAIGNSGRREAVPIMRHYLQSIWHKADNAPGFSDDQQRESSIKVMIKVFHPELEDEFWQLVSYKVKQDHFNKFGPIPKFIQSRISRGGNPEELTGRIVGCQSLTEDQKGPLLAQVNHPSAGVWLAVAGDRLGDYQRDELMDEVCRLPPNPALDKFLVESWVRSHKLHPGHIRSHWNLAILSIDTPQVREFILAQLNADDARQEYKAWQNITDLPEPIVPGRLAHLNWLVPELRKATQERRYGSVALLMDIGTPDANALLQEWADDRQSGVSSNARAILNRPAEYEAARQKKNAEQLVKVNDLLSGRIKPDNLLPPYPSAKWNGETYEPVPVPKAAK